MHYFVDGYNLLFRSKNTHDGLQQQREGVIAFLLEKVSLLELNVTLVFDSKYTAELSTKNHIGALEIVYSGAGETADTYILNELVSCKARQRETVISSDKLLAEHARRLGAKTMNVESFCAWLQARFQRRRGKSSKATFAGLVKLPPFPVPKILPSTPAPPPTKSPSDSDQSYLQIFEARLKELTDNQSPKLHKNKRSGQIKTRERKRKTQVMKEAPEADHERWLRLFQAGIEEDENC